MGHPYLQITHQQIWLHLGPPDPHGARVGPISPLQTTGTPYWFPLESTVHRQHTAPCLYGLSEWLFPVHTHTLPGSKVLFAYKGLKGADGRFVCKKWQTQCSKNRSSMDTEVPPVHDRNQDFLRMMKHKGATCIC